MRRLASLALGLAALASAACGDAANTNSNANLSNANRANANAANANNANSANANTANANRDGWDVNITEADYERRKDEFAQKARAAGETVGSGLKDGWLHVKTKAALAAADDLKDSTINVDVDNAAVTLRGTVDNAAQKSKAEAVAKGINGVKSVKNQLAVGAAGGAGNANNANHKGGGH